MTKVSVVIPVYNAEDFLEESINSVLNQTLTDIELICVNDGSTDNSLNMLLDFAKKDNRVKVIDKPNGGCGSARNKALDNATGEFIYFFDPDDYILNNCFEELYKNAKSNNSDLVMFKIARFRDGEPIDYSIPGFNFDEIFQNVNFENFSFTYHDIKHYVLNASFAPWTKLYRKDFLDRYDDFRFPLGVPFDDVPFHVKSVLRASSISFVPEFFYRYRLSNSNSVNNTASNGIGIFKICDIVETFLKKENYYEDFEEEFILFKLRQILNYLNSTNTEEYFQKTKEEFIEIKNNYFNNISFKKRVPKRSMNQIKEIISSNSMESYNFNEKINSLKNINLSIKNENEKLSQKNHKINQDFKNYINHVNHLINKTPSSDIDLLFAQFKFLNKELYLISESNNKNQNILDYKISQSGNIKPDVTIILPSYNVVKYIDQCISSVLNQSLKNIEIICVDAGSTDGTLEILKEYESQDYRIKLMLSDKKSYGYQVNLALNVAQGKYVGIVETDDYVEENMFEVLYAMTEKATVDICKVNFYHFSDNPENNFSYIDGTKKNLPTNTFTIFDNENILNGHPSIWAAIYRAEFIRENNIKFMELDGGAWVDNPFYFETFLLAESIKYKDEPYYYYRESNPNSSTNNLPNLNLPLERMQDNLDVFDRLNCDNEKVLKALYTRIFWQIKDIYKKISHDKNDEIFENIKNILNRMDEQVVKKYFDSNDLTIYYKGLNKEKPLNLLLISSDNNKTSGAFLSMANLAYYLKNKYHVNVHVIVPYEHHGSEVLNKFKIKYTVIPSKDWVIPLSAQKNPDLINEINEKRGFNEEAIEKITKFIEDKNIDLVHINTTYSYVGALACLETNTPFVWHLREFLEEDQSNTLWDRTNGNKLINKSNKIIAISESIYRKYENVFDENKLVKIHNGIDAKRFYKPFKSIFNDETIKLLMVGGFEYYKGQIEFAKACVTVIKKGYENIEIGFVGLGTKKVKNEVKEIFESEKLLNHVKFYGYQYDVEKYYEEADISFTCAKSEAFGRTTVEAMLSGNLVIGADTAGTKELIKNNETGYLYKQGNSVDLAKTIIYSINNIEISKQIAQKGRSYMYDNMTAEKNADNIHRLYNEILNLK